MKLARFVLSFAVAALVFASGTFAAENKGTLHLSDKVSLEGKVLAPGTYKVEWQGNGPSVQVTLVKDKETVATFSAHRADLAEASRADAYGTQAGPNGTPTLKALYFGGKKFSLQIEETQATQQSNSQNANQ